MTQTLKHLPSLVLLLVLGGCTLAPSPYGGPPVVDRSVRPAPPAAQPQMPPPVEVNPLSRPQPLAPQAPLQTGPVVPANPYGDPNLPPGAAQPQPVAPQQPAPAPEQPMANAAPTPAAQGNQAVAALLDNAAKSVNAGDLDKAAANLERALRIEPRNAGIWHDLAQVRLHQRKYQEAEALATKSNSFAGNNRDLQARNWRVIAAARRAAGDAAGADAAEAQASILKRG
ncbi:MAG TPA: tetratricopeptide repeat protein [Candidatus Competibacteraceae bacterium]|nr:tetratricopeptide repeat protein [Candidatus Competibacteraceae bacterium]